MKKVFTLFSVLFAFVSNAQQNNFRIIGTTPQDIDATISLIINKDTLNSKVVNKQFIFEGHVDGPTRVLLKSDQNCGSQFFIEPAEMKLTTTLSPNSHCIFKQKLTGSATQDLYENFIEGSQKTREKYKGTNMMNKMKDYVSDFVAANPASVVSTYLVEMNARGCGYEWTKATFASLSEEQKNSLQGLDIQMTLAQLNLLKVGNSIVDFSQRDINDSVFHLSSLKGKYVLIDFWASWCGPCRKENPNVKKVYEKYHLQGFEIVGVSLDSDSAKWKSAVEKDGLTWTQISDLKGWNNDIASIFEINAIPANILIDKEGKIVAINLRGGELERAVKKCFNKKD